MSGNKDFDLNNYRRKNQGGKRRTTAPRRRKKTSKEKILRSLLAVFMVCVILGCVGVGGFLIYIFNFVDDDLGVDLEEFKKGGTTTILVKNTSGDWEEYQRLHTGENRIWVSLEQIPDNLENAFIAIEDKRFENHGGVDWKQTFKAFANSFLHFYSSNRGGSTITQQLVKNLTGDKEQNWQRKVREIMRARKLEKTVDKDTILECYLNVVGMANGISGVEVAANYYFDKSVGELTLAECASLASITKYPEALRPDKFPEENKKRRDTVLYEMYDQGYISHKEYENAIDEKLVVVADLDNIKQKKYNSYFVDALIDDVINDLVEKYKYNKADAEMLVYSGGYKIYSTMNPNVQNTIDSVFSDSKTYGLKASNGAIMQGAITVMDYSGHIVGMSGGIGEKNENRGFNRAIMAARQPGSTMKPIAAYAPALEKNVITYSTVVEDKYKRYGGWNPNNWYGGYWGNITTHYALERSVNTIPVYLVNKISLQTSYKFLTESLGITTLESKDINLSALGMGGTYKGLTTTESAAAYAVFGNNGVYYKPTTYYYVEDHDGNKILEYDDYGKRALSEDTATVMNRMLQTVVYGPNGTGGGAAGYVPGMRIFAKTGTSDSTKDLWFVGGSPYYVASCWCGYDNNETIRSQVIAQRMWGKVMSGIHKGVKAKGFGYSKYTSTRYYCAETGLLATDKCNKTEVGYYKNSYLPICSHHGGSLLAPISGGSATANGKSGLVNGKVTFLIEIETSESEESQSDSESSTSVESSANSSQSASQ